MKKSKNSDEVMDMYMRRHDNLTEQIYKMERKIGVCDKSGDNGCLNDTPFYDTECGKSVSNKEKTRNNEITRLFRKLNRLEKKIRKLQKETGYAIGGEY